MTCRKDLRVLVTETYISIQGESTWAGLPCFFIRLTGCPLRCRWCDTEHAFQGGEHVEVSALARQAFDSGTNLVEVTGGEPLAQAGCVPLCEALVETGSTVLIETAGSHPIETLPDEVIRIMDLKCPGSGECEKNRWENVEYLTPRDEVKFVLSDRSDFDWACEMVRRYDLTKRVRAVHFSPVHGELDLPNLAEWIMREHLPVRLHLQLHKFVWEPERRGV